MIRLEVINKFYNLEEDKFQVLKNINLHVEKGEFLAIMGPSGSGKSTMIKILGLLDRDYEGQFLLNEENTKALNDDMLSSLRNEKIGYVFQDFNLIKRLTIKENIELPMLYGGKSQKECNKRVDELLDTFNLKDKKYVYPSQLSGGQQQRISIARALVNNPEIIIADEPTGALDSKTSEKIMEIFEELNNKGITIILITHDIKVSKIARRVVRIYDGVLKEGDESNEA